MQFNVYTEGEKFSESFAAFNEDEMFDILVGWAPIRNSDGSQSHKRITKVWGKQREALAVIFLQRK